MNTATLADLSNQQAEFYVAAAALEHRRQAPKLRAEAAAACALSKTLAEDPALAVRHVLEIARDLCDAQSAGLCLLQPDQCNDLVRWEAVSGMLANYEGTSTLLSDSPCGLCLERGITIVIEKPARAFDHLRDIQPTISEILLVPLYHGDGKALGALWISHHASEMRFDCDDARIAEQLAAQLVLALRLEEQSSERRKALAVIESHQLAQRNLLSYHLYRERRLRERIESEVQQTLVFKDAMIDEVNHRTKNTLQVASGLLSLYARTTASAQVRAALLESSTRLHLLAKVHELLYADPDSKQNVCMSQLLQSLGEAIRQSFGRSPRVELEVTSDPMTLPAQNAIAIALLANEAVTNAYKHAFPDDRDGVITVSLRCTPEHAMILRISDTGIGLQVDGVANGMGLKLLRTIAGQLNGTLEIVAEDAGGTRISLTIHAPANHDGTTVGSSRSNSFLTTA